MRAENRQVYITPDGQEFSDRTEAMRHEKVEMAKESITEFMERAERFEGKSGRSTSAARNLLVEYETHKIERDLEPKSAQQTATEEAA